MAQLVYFRLFRIGESHFAESVLQAHDGAFMVAGRTETTHKTSGVVVRLAPGPWQKTYGTGAINMINAITQTLDEAFVFVGDHFTNQNSTSARIWIVKIDKAGSVIWERIIDDKDHEEHGYGVAASPDGGVVVAGVSTKIGTNKPIGIVAKFDAGGGLLWQQGSAEGVTYAVTLTLDGGYALCGIHEQGLNSPVYVVRLAGDGTRMWERVYNQFQVFEMQKCGIIENHNSQLVIAPPGFVIQTDGDGNVKWSRTTGNLALHSVARFKDHTYAVGGSLIQNGTDHFYVAALSEDGNSILWDNTELAPNSNLGSLIVDNHGNLAAAGTWPTDLGGPDGLVLAIVKQPAI